MERGNFIANLPDIVKGFQAKAEKNKVKNLICELKSHPELLPGCILLIPDGNRRFARANGMRPEEGHRAGANIVIDVAKAFNEIGIRTFMVWGLSEDNLRNRSSEELKNIYSIIGDTVDQWGKELADKDGKFIHIGRKDRFPQILVDKLSRVENKTKNNQGNRLVVALDYGEETEDRELIKEVVRKVAEEQKGFSFEEGIDTLLRARTLERRGIRMVDLVIRTSGEFRLSGFGHLAAYAEFYFIKKNLPNVTLLDILNGVKNYTSRDRRGGR